MSSNLLDKIIEYGFYLLVFLLPLQTRLFLRQGQLNNSYFEYWTVSLYAVDILLLLILSLAFYKNFARIIKIENKKRYWFLAGLELAIFISIFFAPNKLLAVYGYIRFLLGVGFFWLMTELKYDQNKMLFSFLLGAFWQAVIGIWQFFSQSTFASEYLGAAMHNAGDLGISVIETGGERWLRAYGALDHPNMLGGLMAVAILFLILFWLKNKGENNFYKIICPIFLAVYLSALFFSFSRAAWLGLFLGLAVLFFISVIKKNLGAQKRLLEIFLFSGIILFIFFNIYQNLFTTRLSANERLEIKSNYERIESYKSAWDVIKENKFFGVGINNYADYILLQNKDMKSWNYQPAHNVFLLVWSEIGLFGLFFFVGFLIWIAKGLIEKRDVLSISILFCLMIMFMFDHWWWSLHFGVFLFWFVMGMMMRETHSV